MGGNPVKLYFVYILCTILKVHLLFFGTVLYSIREVNVLELLNPYGGKQIYLLSLAIVLEK